MDASSDKSPADVEKVAAEYGSKEAFLSTFTQAENKAIMRKVDRRFLVIIGRTNHICPPVRLNLRIDWRQE